MLATARNLLDSTCLPQTFEARIFSSCPLRSLTQGANRRLVLLVTVRRNYFYDGRSLRQRKARATSTHRFFRTRARMRFSQIGNAPVRVDTRNRCGSVIFIDIKGTKLASDTGGMAKKPELKLTAWTIYKLAAKATWLGEVEAADEAKAIERAAEEYKVPASKLMATRRP
jgi:hypothetical protein